ncbi:AraC family transcriptional regulator [Paenibacillus sp. FJAT-27812]|uniref:AraC family transcriptional regulator n=1 Tax=Paenibacillus sp. FJAT-27812 TaxID=1684143 RepID=UPI0006A7A42C|nr:AraC family transcriptional regulator [Paenibacillus sp. FJAT-27812]
MPAKLEPVRKEFMLPDMDSTFRVFAAHWRTVDPDWKYPLHKHPLFEVNLVLSGVQEMTVNGVAYVQNSGDLMLLNPGDNHGSKVVGGEEMTYYCLHFDVDERSFRELLVRNSRCFHESGSELAVAIKPALDKIMALTSKEAAGRVESRMSILSALFELFAGLSGTLSELNRDAAGARKSAAASQIAVKLEQAVESAANGGEKDSEMDTIRSIAASVGYSMSSVNRMFTHVYGVSPRQYLSQLILKKAKLLLMDPDASVESISAKLGYHNMAHFSRQFKRWTGESPSSFRGRLHE